MPQFLQIEGTLFKDEHKRQVTLRGVNLAADAKLPAHPNLPSHCTTDFFDGDNVSFVGRPFPYEEADLHLMRLRAWGFNTIRYIFTWEAIESRGPYVSRTYFRLWVNLANILYPSGIYDEEWIQSTIALLRKCKEHGLFVFMDPHQDVVGKSVSIRTFVDNGWCLWW